MSQKNFYNDNAKKFLIHKTKFNQTDQIWEKFIDKIIWNHIWKKILDYWCGWWEIWVHHINIWAEFVLWVDISKELLEIALKRTIKNKNIEFMSIDDKNYTFNNIIGNDFFDYIVSYYVFCTIEDSNIMESIINSFNKKLKIWWKVLLLMPNRDNFNWKCCYWFSFIKDLKLKDWNLVTTYLRTNNTKLPLDDKKESSHLKITDIFWSKKKIRTFFEKHWFKTKIHNIYINKWEYKWIVDEDKHSPMYVLEAIKS